MTYVIPTQDPKILLNQIPGRGIEQTGMPDTYSLNFCSGKFCFKKKEETDLGIGRIGQKVIETLDKNEFLQ